MPESDTEIALHNYPQSHVVEKVRVALGIKGLSWRNVEIPRLPQSTRKFKMSYG